MKCFLVNILDKASTKAYKSSKTAMDEIGDTFVINSHSIILTVNDDAIDLMNVLSKITKDDSDVIIVELTKNTNFNLSLKLKPRREYITAYISNSLNDDY